MLHIGQCKDFNEIHDVSMTNMRMSKPAATCTLQRRLCRYGYVMSRFNKHMLMQSWQQSLIHDASNRHPIGINASVNKMERTPLILQLTMWSVSKFWNCFGVPHSVDNAPDSLVKFNCRSVKAALLPQEAGKEPVMDTLWKCKLDREGKAPPCVQDAGSVPASMSQLLAAFAG